MCIYSIYSCLIFLQYISISVNNSYFIYFYFVFKPECSTSVEIRAGCNPHDGWSNG